MDREFLSYYEGELTFLRQMGREFAQAYPKVAGRLTLDQIPCPDPYVERLLEGVAFLTARVQMKMESHFPRFTSALLETVCPGYIAPTPSMLIAQFQPDPAEKGLVAGFKIPRGAAMRSLIGPGEQTACEYRTAQDTTLWPFTVVQAAYHVRDINSLSLPDLPRIKAVIRIRLACGAGITWDKVQLDRLCLFIGGSSSTQARLYQQIFADAAGVIVQPTAQVATKQSQISAENISRVGFRDDEALLPVTPRGFSGYRLLHEYSVIPQRFLFFAIDGLRQAVNRIAAPQIDILIPLREVDAGLENVVNAAHFLPHCTPAINLFPKVCDRIPVSDQFSEFHVVPDRTRARDFEVVHVNAVTGYGARNDEQQAFLPFYSVSDMQRQQGGAFFTANRRPRMLSERDRRVGARSQYAGTEVFLSLVDAANAPYSLAIKQLGVETLCSNRDLPLFIPAGKGPTDFTLQISAPVKSIRCIGGVPSAPRNPLADAQTAWRLISHLSVNYLSLIDSGEREGAAALRSMLELYADPSDLAYRKQVQGLRGISCKPIMRRLSEGFPSAFVRGLEISVLLEEQAFEGTGAFLMGAVLEQFFTRYTAINSFTQTVISTVENGRIMEWRPQPGRRRVI